MKKMLIGFILGGLLFGSMVYAASYNANDITYTKPGASTSITVKSALDELYTRASGKSNSGSFTTVAGENSIDVGFVPSKMVIYYNSNMIILYDSTISTTKSYAYKLTAPGYEQTITTTNTSHAAFTQIGTTTKIYLQSAGLYLTWFAVE